MTEDEIVELLTFTSTHYDHRHVTAEETEAWQRALWRLDLEDAKAAVAEHYAWNRERVMPADVNGICRPPAARHPSSAPVPARLDVAEGVSVLGASKVRKALAEAHAGNQSRRARVLKYADLARRLCEPPLSYKFPEQWNGFVPPAELQDEIPEVLHSSAPNVAHKMTGTRKRNNAPQRAALVDICAEAMCREEKRAAENGGAA